LSARVKLGIIWGAIAAFIIVGINVIRHLFDSRRQFSGGTNGFRSGGMMSSQGGMMGNQGGMMNRQGGFGRHAFMDGHHHGGDFHIFGVLLFLIIAAAIVILVMRWLRRKTKSSSMQQLIDTPFVSSHTTVSSMNGNILDQWEKSLKDQKENEKNGNF
jgi:uncharacterized membrane protein